MKTVPAIGQVYKSECIISGDAGKFIYKAINSNEDLSRVDHYVIDSFYGGAYMLGIGKDDKVICQQMMPVDEIKEEKQFNPIVQMSDVKKHNGLLTVITASMMIITILSALIALLVMQSMV